MSGHSKWNNIKNKKGKEDAKKGKIFTKLARQITVAAKEGGSDPEYNASLKVAIDKAKAENMPNDNIDRAIKKGSGEEGSDDFEEVVYEGYGPNGVAVMVNCLTDNRNRTAPEIRHLFDKYNGNLGQPGCVSFMFDQKGVFGLLKDGIEDEDEFTLKALEYGAEDVKDMGEGYEIITSPDDYHSVRKSLEDEGYSFVESDITYIPQTTVSLTDEKDISNMEKLVDALEDNDDVQDVFTSWERD